MSIASCQARRALRNTVLIQGYEAVYYCFEVDLMSVNAMELTLYLNHQRPESKTVNRAVSVGGIGRMQICSMTAESKQCRSMHFTRDMVDL